MANVTIPGILLLLAMLQLKHAVCDGLLQTQGMLKDKGQYGRPGGFAHAGLHGTGSLVVFLLFGIGALPAVLLAAADALIHYHVDFAKETMVRRNGWSQDKPVYWWVLMADQMLHQFTYLGLSFAVTTI
jgi:Protein of unknown function (DUF3307)